MEALNTPTDAYELAPYLSAATLVVRPDLQKFILVNPHHAEKAADSLADIIKKVDALLLDCGRKSGIDRAAFVC